MHPYHSTTANHGQVTVLSRLPKHATLVGAQRHVASPCRSRPGFDVPCDSLFNGNGVKPWVESSTSLFSKILELPYALFLLVHITCTSKSTAQMYRQNGLYRTVCLRQCVRAVSAVQQKVFKSIWKTSASNEHTTRRTRDSASQHLPQLCCSTCARVVPRVQAYSTSQRWDGGGRHVQRRRRPPGPRRTWAHRRSCKSSRRRRLQQRPGHQLSEMLGLQQRAEQRRLPGPGCGCHCRRGGQRPSRRSNGSCGRGRGRRLRRRMQGSREVREAVNRDHERRLH